VAGAIPVRDQVDLITKAGFIGVEHVGFSGFTTSRFTVAALFRARKPNRDNKSVVSAA
jgi:hypothetical protein